MTRFSSTLLLLALCSGSLCLPRPVAAVDVEQLKALQVKPTPGKALVYLYRAGSALEDYKLLFDDRKIPMLFAKSFIVIETDPGRHRIEAKQRGTGMNRAGVGSFELYTFEAGQVYFIENSIGVDPRNYSYNVPISEFWKRKESHWLKVRNSLSFLDYVDTATLGLPRDTTQVAQAPPPPVVPPAPSAPAAPVVIPPPAVAPRPVLAAAPAAQPTAAPVAAVQPARQPALVAAPEPARVARPLPAAPPAPAPLAVVVPAPATLPLPVPAVPAVTATPAPAALPATPAVTASAARPGVNPHAVAVIIGNRNYSKNNRDLPDVDYAHNDAQAVYDYVRNTLGYREGNIIFLKDATQAQLLSVFGIPGDPEGKLFNWVRPGQSDVFVYYSGHGVPGVKDARSYLLPVDADPTTVQINGYRLETLYANLAAIPARSLTVVLDACFSGASAGGAVFQKASSITLRAADPATLPPHGSLFTATGPNEVASWDGEAHLGLFTRSFLDGLKGAADGQGYGNGDGQVTVAELKTFLADEVTYSARRHFGRKQTPQVFGPGERVLATVH